jgi:hypothetical protein
MIQVSYCADGRVIPYITLKEKRKSDCVKSGLLAGYRIEAPMLSHLTCKKYCVKDF